MKKRQKMREEINKIAYLDTTDAYVHNNYFMSPSWNKITNEREHHIQQGRME